MNQAQDHEAVLVHVVDHAAKAVHDPEVNLGDQDPVQEADQDLVQDDQDQEVVQRADPKVGLEVTHPERIHDLVQDLDLAPEVEADRSRKADQDPLLNKMRCCRLLEDIDVTCIYFSFGTSKLVKLSQF